MSCSENLYQGCASRKMEIEILFLDLCCNKFGKIYTYKFAIDGNTGKQYPSSKDEVSYRKKLADI